MNDESKPTRLVVKGMTCSNCVRHATEALQGIGGVASVSVTLEPGRAEVFWEPAANQNIPALIQSLRRGVVHPIPICKADLV